MTGRVKEEFSMWLDKEEMELICAALDVYAGFNNVWDKVEPLIAILGDRWEKRSKKDDRNN